MTDFLKFMAYTTLLFLFLVGASSVRADGFNPTVTIGLGYTASIDRPRVEDFADGSTWTHNNFYSGNPLATIRIDQTITPKLGVELIHISNLTRFDADYGINAVMLTYRLR